MHTGIWVPKRVGPTVRERFLAPKTRVHGAEMPGGARLVEAASLWPGLLGPRRCTHALTRRDAPLLVVAACRNLPGSRRRVAAGISCGRGRRADPDLLCVLAFH